MLVFIALMDGINADIAGFAVRRIYVFQGMTMKSVEIQYTVGGGKSDARALIILNEQASIHTGQQADIFVV